METKPIEDDLKGVHYLRTASFTAFRFSSEQPGTGVRSRFLPVEQQ